MVNARALGLTNGKTLGLLETSPLDAPLGVQLLAREPDDLVRALEVLDGYPCSLVDLNAACPVKKVTRKGEGAALLREPETLSKLVSALVANSRLPVTVKIRSGWDQATVNAPEIARRIAGAGADAICIHGRTRNQGYGGKADLTVVSAVKQAVSIPVIASGDIFSAAAARKMWNETGCDAVMVARGALGNPWIFREIAAIYRGEDRPPRPTPEELRAAAREHFTLSVQYLGERLGVINFRKFFAWYTKGLKNARSMRPRVVRACTVEEVEALMEELCKGEA
jgi:tRNA-dihydrouridine synthase B